MRLALGRITDTHHPSPSATASSPPRVSTPTLVTPVRCDDGACPKNPLRPASHALDVPFSQTWNSMEVCPTSGLVFLASYDVPVLTVVRLTPEHRMSHIVEFELKYPILSMTSLSGAHTSGEAVAGECARWGQGGAP